ncbi:murein biosynthesis integral membrane protein MurJ [Cellulomonas sp. DKR-3]|uniref:Murein biosynthesis integral membrane protein MurJ n=2 Tax=Cellulomonas fulva TaxID=2835530 RepID=A0ABS5TWG9_9CELL|nr:murein biosynthesis integral membrane protein MurJ [Cellulomonas fulva]
MRRGAALMASGTAVSRLLGLLRSVVLIAAIGATGQAADAFAVANKLPNVLYMLLVGGVLNAVLVPQVVRAYKRHAGQEYVDRLLTFGFAVLAALSLVMTIAAPLLVSLYAKPGNQVQHDLAVTFAYWCVPQIFFYGAYALLGQVLNARHSFGPYMWAPVVNNVVSIAGFGIFLVAFGSVPGSGLTRAAQWGGGQVALLAGSATLGVVLQAVVLIPALRRAGVHYRPRWGLRGSGLGRAGTVATWTLVGLAIGQLGYVVVSRVASAAPGAAKTAALAAGEPFRAVAGNAAYDAAFLVFMLPHSLVTVSLATALFTRLSEQAHEGDTDGVRSTFSSGVRVVGVFTLLAAAVIAVLAEPVTRIVMPTERPATVHAVSAVVVAMILGLPAFGAWSMAQRLYYAYEDTRGMVPVQGAMAAVVVLGALVSQAVLEPSRWVVGIGAAMSISYVVGAVVSLWHLRRRLGSVDGGRILRMHLRGAIAALVAAGAGVLLLRLVEGALGGSFPGAVTECVLVGAVMVVVYAVVLRLLRVRELEDLLRPVLARAGRLGPLGRLVAPRRAGAAPAEATVPRGPSFPTYDEDPPPASAPPTPTGAGPREPRSHRSRPHYPVGDPRHRPPPPTRFLAEEPAEPPERPAPRGGRSATSGTRGGTPPGTPTGAAPGTPPRPAPGGPPRTAPDEASGRDVDEGGPDDEHGTPV